MQTEKITLNQLVKKYGNCDVAGIIFTDKTYAYFLKFSSIRTPRNNKSGVDTSPQKKSRRNKK